MFRTVIKSIVIAAGVVGASAASAQSAWQVERDPDGQFYAFSQAGTDQVQALAIGCYGSGPSLVVLLRNYRGGAPIIRLTTPTGKLDIAMRARGGGWISADSETLIADLLAGAPYVDIAVNGRGAGRMSLDGARPAIGRALGSCWSASEPAPAAAPSGTPAPAPPAGDEAAARAFIASIYNVYVPGHEDEPYPEVFSPGLESLVQAAYGDEPMDGDPFCSCQDYDGVRWSIVSLKLEGDRGVARISFTNFGQTEPRELRLVRTPAGWRVNDIVYFEPEPGSFRDMLSE